MILSHGRVFIGGQFHELDIRLAKGRITEIGPSLEGPEIIDVRDRLIFPGFIDTHIHGAAQANCGDSPEAMRRICALLPQYGVTSFTPTPIASTIEASVSAVRSIRAAKGCSGTDILGIFLYTAYKNRSIPYYDPPVLPTREHTLALADGDLSDITSVLIAPELPGGQEWISWLRSEGVLPVIGFSEGTADQIHQAVKNGATLTDHFFNGFPLMDHHQSGSAVGCLLEPSLYLQMNCDTIHVAPPFLRLAIQMKGIDHIVPVSDSSSFIGLPEGQYDLGGKTVWLKDGSVRDQNGKLVTGAHTYDENMRTLLKAGFTLEEIGTLFSENAARALGLCDRGRIEVGRRGDLVCMDESLNVCSTYILGEQVYRSPQI